MTSFIDNYDVITSKMTYYYVIFEKILRFQGKMTSFSDFQKLPYNFGPFWPPPKSFPSAKFFSIFSKNRWSKIDFSSIMTSFFDNYDVITSKMTSPDVIFEKILRFQGKMASFSDFQKYPIILARNGPPPKFFFVGGWPPPEPKSWARPWLY